MALRTCDAMCLGMMLSKRFSFKVEKEFDKSKIFSSRRHQILNKNWFGESKRETRESVLSSPKMFSAQRQKSFCQKISMHQSHLFCTRYRFIISIWKVLACTVRADCTNYFCIIYSRYTISSAPFIKIILTLWKHGWGMKPIMELFSWRLWRIVWAQLSTTFGHCNSFFVLAFHKPNIDHLFQWHKPSFLYTITSIVN